MAKGKYKRKATTRRSAQSAEVLQQLESEVQTEQAVLAGLAADVAHVNELQEVLERRSAERDRMVADEASRLEREIRLMEAALPAFEAATAAIQERWEKYSGKVTTSLGPGYAGIEAFLQLVSTGGVLANSPAKLGIDGVVRIQQARGERTDANEQGGKPSAAHALQGWLRDRWMRLLAEAGIPTDPLPRAHELTGEQARVLATVETIASTVLASTSWSLSADAVHCWYPLPWLMFDPDREPGPTSERLGIAWTTPPQANPGDESRSDAAWPAATGNLAAVHRARLAELTADDLLDQWHDPLTVRQAIVRATNRLPAPYGRRPHSARPSDATALQVHYGKAAIGLWSRALEAQRPAAVTSTLGQLAVAANGAATFWLPPGQTFGYADSEPLSSDDIDAIRLPFPQILLTFADPLFIPPTQHPDTEQARILTSLDEGVLHLASDSKHSFQHWMTSMGGFDAIGDPLDLVDAIAMRGAHVEGLLLLADSLGRISDQFGWCLSIPATAPGSLGRYLIPASLQATQFQGPVLNLAAVVAWAGWHPPDAATNINGVKPSGIDDVLRSPAFRDADRAGAGGVRVLDVKATTRTEASSDPTDVPRKVAPHLRRGHWRKQRHGPQASLIKRIRIAPVAVNAHLGAIAPRVYRLTADETHARRSTP